MKSIQDKKSIVASKMAPTPFQMIGSGVKKVGRAIGNSIDKNFIEPSRNVNKIQNAKMKDMDRKARAGEFN